jgi:secreted PhoX family phosphatase
MDDSSPLGQVYVYVGNKTAFGTEIDKAGLSNGTLYSIVVSGMANETSTFVPNANTTFSMVNISNALNLLTATGASLNTVSNNLGVTNFLRPEDGCWDPSRPSDFYFNTTNAFNAPSRVWRLRFTDIENPQLGGTITAVLDGTEGQQMLDNMTIDNSGHILLCEDVGNNAWVGRVLEYDIATDVLTPIAQHDANLFLTGGSSFLTQDEETSGIFDAYLCHKLITPSPVRHMKADN